MPFKRKRKPGAFKRKRVFKRRNFKRNTTVMHSTMPIAPRALVQMKYTDTTLPYLPVPATAPTFLFFNLNSIYKPNRTYAGHQPYGHDTFAQLYNRYRIYKVKWTAIFPSSTVDYQIAIGAVNHGAITASLDACAEQPGTITKWVCDGGEAVTLSGVVNLPRLHGNTPAEYKGEDGCSSAFGGSPTEVMTLRTCFYAPNACNVVPTFFIRILY